MTWKILWGKKSHTGEDLWPFKEKIWRPSWQWSSCNCIVRRRTMGDRAASIPLHYGEWRAKYREDGNTKKLAIKYTTIKHLSSLFLVLCSYTWLHLMLKILLTTPLWLPVSKDYLLLGSMFHAPLYHSSNGAFPWGVQLFWCGKQFQYLHGVQERQMSQGI